MKSTIVIAVALILLIGIAAFLYHAKGPQQTGSTTLPNGNVSTTIRSAHNTSTSTMGQVSAIGSGEMFVPNFNDTTVSVINISTNRVVATINVGHKPVSAAVTPNGQMAYVSLSNSSYQGILSNYVSNVAVINTATNMVIKNVSVNGHALGIAISPDGQYVYVTLGGTSEFAAISTYSDTVAYAMSACVSPNSVAITPDGKYAYVGCFQSNDTVIIDLTTKSISATVPLTGRAGGVAISPNGAYAYVTTSFGSAITVINTSTKQAVATIPESTNTAALAFSPNGQYLYVANYGLGTLGVVNTTTNKFVRNITVGSFPNGVAVTSDGKFIYVTVVGLTRTPGAKGSGSGSGSPPGSQYPGYVIVLNATSYSTIAQIQVGKFPFSISDGIVNSV